MKKSELINLRKMYVSELDRLNRIKELLNEETCKELGLSMTTAFTIFAKKMTREKSSIF